jgi:phytoene desaturase
MSTRPVVIVGAGLAGLHAGCILAHRGVKTIIVEKNNGVGGYCSSFTDQGYSFDIGATMLQTPSVLTDALAELGREPSDYLDLRPLDPIYRVSFADGESVTFTRSGEEMADDIARFGDHERAGFLRYMRDMENLKRTFKQFFIARKHHSLWSYLSPSSLRLFSHLQPFNTVSKLVGKYFRDPRLRAAFSFQVLYFGIPPNRCPAVYGMVPYFEIKQGVWYPRGGLNSVSKALAKIFQEEGGQLLTGSPVREIITSGGRVRGVRLEGGEVIEADRVISNADAVYTYLKLLDEGAVPAAYRGKVRKYELSCSAIVAFLGFPKDSFGLLHHNFIIPENPDLAYHRIFREGAMPGDLAAYLCCATRTDETVGPPGSDGLYVLVPAPGRLRDGAPWEERREEAVEFVVSELERRGMPGLREKLTYTNVYLPSDYERIYNQPAGMGFGIQPTVRQMGPLRPKTRSPYVGGLYLAGASTNPGCGVPLVISSGRSAARALLADLDGG